MNDFSVHDRNDPIDRDPRVSPAVDPETENRPTHHPRARRRRGGRWFALAPFLVLAVGLSLGARAHYVQRQQVLVTAQQERDFVPSVRVATVEASPATISITLPGTTAAFAAANIYARATGYIAKRNVDIGDHVRAGDVLAQLAVPELEDQISQNEATLDQLKSALDQAEAGLKLAQVTWSRDEPLVNKGWATQQQGTVDVQTVKSHEAAVAVAQHNVAAQENLLKQLRQNRDYASVVAPFDGEITQRNVDVGSLVQDNATSGTFMFEIVQENVIRVWVYVPQDAAFGVAPGIDAIVHVPEIPDREFSGTVTRVANALQPGTRTLLTEIDISNPDGALKPGAYCSIELHVVRKSPSLSVPADAIIFNSGGMQVAVVSNDRVEIRKVSVTHDLGTRVEVDRGLKAGDQVILNPPVNLVDGGRVQTRLDAAVAAAPRSSAPIASPTDVTKKG
jgi:RND family efflux transporter MFP subunit